MKCTRTLILLLILFIAKPMSADRLASLRSARQIVTVESVSAPYYTTQVVALKEPPGNAAFFAKLSEVFEYDCSDGFVRYTVGRYQRFSDAINDLNALKADGFTDAFILNTRKITLNGSSSEAPVVDKTANPIAGVRYTVQIAALRYPVYVSEFEHFDSVQEYYMRDKIYRYCVGDVDGSEAKAELARVKSLGYPNAFLVPMEKYAPFRIE